MPRRKKVQSTLGISTSAVAKPGVALIQERNPMKIEPILETFFDFCPTETLKNCRLVCKQWRDQSLKVWREKAMIRLKDLEKWEAPTIEDYTRQYNQAANGNKKNDSMLSHLRQHPFRNFLIDTVIERYLKTDSGPITDLARHVTVRNLRHHLSVFVKFLSKVESLEDLELKNCELWWDKNALQLLMDLKCLKIYQDRVATPNVVTKDERFFQLLPNLEVLCLEHRGIDSGLTDSKLTLENVKRAIICAQEENHMHLDLKELEIIISPPSPGGKNMRNKHYINLMETIDELYFPLERLVLEYTFSGKMKIFDLYRPIHRLLSYTSESLQYLRTSFYFDVDSIIDNAVGDSKGTEKELKLKKAIRPIRMTKIKMFRLKELRLADGLWGFYLLFYLQLPNLEKLVVEYGKHTKKANILEYHVQLLKEILVLEKLETFELLDNYKIPGLETITAFSNMMPNLIHLSVPLDKKTFPIVCKKFKGLKILNILAAECRYAEIDDETLTGMPDRDNKGGPRRPNITDLALLTDLSIATDIAFTDHAVTHGFLQLSKLFSLNVALKVSEEIKAKLLKHVIGYARIEEEERTHLNDDEDDEYLLTDDSDASESESSDESDSSQGSGPESSDLNEEDDSHSQSDSD